MSRWIRGWALLGFCFACWLVLAAQRQPAITNLAQFYSRPCEGAREGEPVRIRAVILCYDQEWNQLFLHDGAQTFYLPPQGLGPGLQRGRAVEVTAATTCVGHSPQFTNVALRLLGPTRLPSPRRTTLSQLGSVLDQWVELTGRVRAADASSGRLLLTLHDQGQSCQVQIMAPLRTNDFRGWLDRTVRVRAINTSTVVDGRLVSASLVVPGFDELMLLPLSTPEPGRLPVTSIGGLLNRELGSWTNNRVHLKAVVIAYEPGKVLIVRDPSGTIRASIVQAGPLELDQRVDLWGYLSVSGHGPFLTDAYFEPVGAASPVGGGSVLRAPAPDSHPLPTLAQAADIRKLQRDQAARQLPVRLRGVMTYADQEWGVGFFQDTTAGIYTDPVPTNAQAGQWVELNGQTGPGGYAPEVIHASIQVLGVTNLPTPVQVRLEDLSTGVFDSSWLALEGRVREATVRWNHLQLRLMAPGGRFKATIPAFFDAAQARGLLDAYVRIQGACSSEVNPAGQLAGVTLYVPSLAQVEILEPGLSNVFALPATSVHDLARFDPEHRAGYRLKVSGVVTMNHANGAFTLQDATGGVEVRPAQVVDIQPGDLAEAAGFLSPGGFSPHLIEALVRKRGTDRLSTAPRTTAERILVAGTNDHTLVTLEARLLRDIPHSASPQLVLQDGSVIFTAHFDAPLPEHTARRLTPGCLVRLSGVCSIAADDRHEASSLELLIPGPQALTLLQAAPWWSEGRTRAAMGVIILVLLAAMGWVVSLRARVRFQTARIRDELGKEAALEKRYRALIETANDAMVFTDVESGLIVGANPKAADLLCRPVQELLGTQYFDLFPAEERDRCRELASQHAQAGGAVAADVHVCRPDGTQVPVEVSTSAADVNGRRIMQGILRDLTERMRALRAIQESEARLGEAQRIAHLGSWEVRLPVPEEQSEGSLKWSDEVFRIFGREPGQGPVSHEAFYEAVHPEDRAAVRAAVREAIENHKRYSIEHRIVRPDGEERIVCEEAQVFFNATGQARRMVGTVQDVTERKRLEDHLRQAQRMESIGTLAGGVAHDFNNILAVILMNAELARGQTNLAPDIREVVDEIHTAADRAASLTRQLLAFSRRQALQRQRLNLSEAVLNLVKMLNRILGEDITVECRCPRRLPPVLADPSMVDQLLMNLAANSRDAMPHGGRLQITTEVVKIEVPHPHLDARLGTFVCLRVTDTGCGIEPAVLGRVFEPFFTTKPLGKGTGLGLATVYGIVRQHEGWIELTSQVGKGTTFNIFFPPAPETAEPARRSPTSEPGPRGHETILLVEDAPAVRLLVQRVLTQHGYTVLPAADGAEALRLWEQHGQTVDLLLTDIVMPNGLDGLELSDRLSAAKPDLAVIITTGYSLELASKAASSRPRQRVLLKPYEPAELLQTVRSCLNETNSANAEA